MRWGLTGTGVPACGWLSHQAEDEDPGKKLVAPSDGFALWIEAAIQYAALTKPIDLKAAKL